MSKIIYWITVVSRGYSAPMSIINWLVAFVYIIKMFAQANVLYGILALIAIVLAHLGTNLFDDFIDDFTNTPKQECKTRYLKEGFTTIKSVFIASITCFLLTILIGIFFVIKIGTIVLIPAIITGVIILLYPKLNNFALGEVAVGLCFGILMFIGISVVMIGRTDINTVLISVPVSILTSAVVFCHSIMDYEFDKKSKKNTLSVLLGKNNSLILLMIFYFSALIITLIFAKTGVMPRGILISIFIIPFLTKLYKQLKNYNSKEKSEFMKNFILARNISLFYNIALVALWLI